MNPPPGSTPAPSSNYRGFKRHIYKHGGLDDGVWFSPGFREDFFLYCLGRRRTLLPPPGKALATGEGYSYVGASGLCLPPEVSFKEFEINPGFRGKTVGRTVDKFAI